eukprot:Skav222267  [mRNA]  locus=scaffold2459:54457:54774:+ [translate_table: standard]
MLNHFDLFWRDFRGYLLSVQNLCCKQHRAVDREADPGPGPFDYDYIGISAKIATELRQLSPLNLLGQFLIILADQRARLHHPVLLILQPGDVYAGGLAQAVCSAA